MGRLSIVFLAAAVHGNIRDQSCNIVEPCLTTQELTSNGAASSGTGAPPSDSRRSALFFAPFPPNCIPLVLKGLFVCLLLCERILVRILQAYGRQGWQDYILRGSVAFFWTTHVLNGWCHWRSIRSVEASG